MIGVWSRIRDALDRHGRVAMVTIAATRGSSPREAGARLLVNPDGTFTGTIGGGTLEWKAIAIAQAALAKSDAARAELRGFALGPELGQCCGGSVELIVELIEQGQRDDVNGLAEREAAGPFATRARLSPDRGVIREITDIDLPPGAARYAAGVLTEGFGDDRRPVTLFGAGHVGRALVLALAPLPFAVTWVDPRPDAFPSHVPGNVVVRHSAEPDPVLAAAPAGSFVLVMTHSHQLDLAVVAAALVEGRFPYVGLIGSRTKRVRFERRLAEAGIPAGRIGDLVCPIGGGGVRSKAPAMIAAATAVELLLRDEAMRAVPVPAEERRRSGHG
jgi:xanthine dehydrogenase accessory factor